MAHVLQTAKAGIVDHAIVRRVVRPTTGSVLATCQDTATLDLRSTSARCGRACPAETRVLPHRALLNSAAPSQPRPHGFGFGFGRKKKTICQTPKEGMQGGVTAEDEGRVAVYAVRFLPSVFA